MGLRSVMVHNFYRTNAPSGENRVVESDVAALLKDGVDVQTFYRNSDELENWSAVRKSTLLVQPTWSRQAVADFRTLLAEFQPDIVHLHNPFPLISPGIVRAAHASDVAVVQTVHNFRHACVAGTHFRDGQVCTDCVGKSVPWPALRHGCYQNSVAATVPMVVAQVAHSSTWQMVDCFLPVGEGVAEHLSTFDIPENRIRVRPNVVEDPGTPAPLGKGVLYVGRLSEEKGVAVLLEAWDRSGLGRSTTLTIAGGGEMVPVVERAVGRDASIRYGGFLGKEQLTEAYRSCALVVVPSLWFEADPLSVLGAMAHGRPVVAMKGGAMEHYLDDDSGWLAEVNAGGLSRSLVKATSDQAEIQRRAHGARGRYVRDRLPENAVPLRTIYEELLDSDA